MITLKKWISAESVCPTERRSDGATERASKFAERRDEGVEREHRVSEHHD